MLSCCNNRFRGGYSYVLSNKDDFYRRIEYGICPNCGSDTFVDYRIIKGIEKIRRISGRKALSALEKIKTQLKNIKYGSNANQNYHYGDFKATGRFDINGNPIYLQLRKNFNGEIEILNEISTKTYSSIC